MVKFIPVRYNNKEYPDGIDPKIQEIPAHFDSNIVKTDLEYSLHTEYSYEKREMTSNLIRNFQTIIKSRKNGVPQLWFNEEWSKEFSDFIKTFVNTNAPPKIIEIHPPFSDYCTSLFEFIEMYKKFEEKILSVFPNTEILIENRYGSQYSGGAFILSTVDDLKELTELIKKLNLKLRIALDFPQLFSAHQFIIGNFSKNGLLEIFKQLYPVREYIASIHLWGKCLGKNNRISAHMGTLDSYFKGLKCEDILTNKVITLNSYTAEDASNNNKDIKKYFLSKLYELLSDGSVRYFLPEVNSKSEHLHSIVRDLIDSGFKFV